MIGEVFFKYIFQFSDFLEIFFSFRFFINIFGFSDSLEIVLGFQFSTKLQRSFWKVSNVHGLTADYFQMKNAEPKAMKSLVDNGSTRELNELIRQIAECKLPSTEGTGDQGEDSEADAEAEQ